MLSAMRGDLVLKPLSRGDLRASTRSLSFLWSCEPCILSTPNPMRECLFPILPGTCCCRGEVGTAVLCAVCCVLCCLQCKELSPTRPKGARGKNALHRCVFNTHHQCVIIMSVGFDVSFRRTKGGFYVSFEGGFTCFLVTVHDTLPEGGFTCLLAGCHSYSYCGLRIPRCRSIQRSTSRPPSTRFGTLLLSSYRIW